MNAIKWVDGSDGLLGRNVFVVMIFLFIIGVRTYSSDVAMYSITIAGGLLGFLVYSFPPAKIYTGGTKTFYGFIIAVFSIINGAKIAATMMIIALPLIDFCYVIISRIIKYKPKNPIEVLKINDRSHIHHKLLELGFSKKHVLLIEASVTMLVSAIAVLTAGTTKLFLLFLFGALIMFAILILHNLARKKSKEQPKKKTPEPPQQTPEGKYAY